MQEKDFADAQLAVVQGLMKRRQIAREHCMSVMPLDGNRGGKLFSGHLGVQFASKMGFKTVAIARGQDKGDLATSLGAAFGKSTWPISAV